MILSIATSKNNVLIRLTRERWRHIVITHQEMDGNDFSKIMKIITDPDFILKGNKGELLAVKKVLRNKLWIVVPYKEVSRQDGFVLTAYFTNDLFWLLKKEILWNK